MDASAAASTATPRSMGMAASMSPRPTSWPITTTRRAFAAAPTSGNIRLMRFVLCALLLTTAARAEDWRPYVFSVAGDTLSAKHAVLENGLGYNGVTGSGGGLSPDSAHRL